MSDKTKTNAFNLANQAKQVQGVDVCSC